MQLHHTTACPCPQHSTVAPQQKQTQLAIALLLVASFAAIELLVGLTSQSLVLVAEAGHMASDSLALVLALVASWAAQFPRQNVLSDSFERILSPEIASDKLTALSQHPASAGNFWEIGAAFINGVGLIVLAVWVAWEAIARLQTPPTEIASLPMLITAVVGVLVNGVNVVVLHHGSEHDLNLKAAFLHVLADMLSSIGVIVAAIAITFFHDLWIDGAISLAIAGLILLSALPVLRQTLKSLLASRNTSQTSM